MELRGLDERVQRGRDLGAAPRLRAVVILAADDESPFILPVAKSPSLGTGGIRCSARRSQIAYRERRRSEDVVVFETPDRSRTILPAWMLDAGACAAMTTGVPRVPISALVELHALRALGFDRGTSPSGNSLGRRARRWDVCGGPHHLRRRPSHAAFSGSGTVVGPRSGQLRSRAETT